MDIDIERRAEPLNKQNRSGLRGRAAVQSNLQFRISDYMSRPI